VSYIAEQAPAEIDTRSDIFFSVILFELATGAHPYPRSTVVEQMAAIIRDEAPRSRRNPLPWTALIDRCLAKDPADRYQSTKDLYLDLRTLRDHALCLSRVRKSRQPRPAATGSVASWHFMLVSAIAAAC